MSNQLGLMLLGWAAVALVMWTLWIVQRIRKNAGIVDVAWALGTGLLGSLYASGAAAGDSTRRFAIAALAAVWGGRLGFYLIRRNLREQEDGRYQQLRSRWGDRAQAYLFVFFQTELFGFEGGRQWWVAQYLFGAKAAAR